MRRQQRPGVEPLEERALLSGSSSTIRLAAAVATPLSVTAGLSPASDPDGNHIVVKPKVVIQGQTAPGATVQLEQTLGGSLNTTTTADSQGAYRFPIKLSQGRSTYNVVSTENGQTATTALTVSRGDVVIDENATLLDAIRINSSAPTVASRQLAMVMVAVYDAVNAVTKTAQPYMVQLKAQPNTSAAAASAAAAETVLSSLFPKQTATFAAMLQEDLATVPNARARTNGVRLGDKVGNAILALRANDGSNAPSSYTPSGLPGTWVPTPPTFTAAVSPQWGASHPGRWSADRSSFPRPPRRRTPPNTRRNTTRSWRSAGRPARSGPRTRRLPPDSGRTSRARPSHRRGTGTRLPRTRRCQRTPASRPTRTFALLNIALADAAIACSGASTSIIPSGPSRPFRLGTSGSTP